MPSIAIIVPCYNEAKRIKALEFISFAKQHPDIQFYFVNDGSTDDTKKILLQIRQSSNSIIICLEKNLGKAEAVRQGFINALEDKHELVGFLDADLSTGLKEFLKLKQSLISQNFDFVLGSRIKKIDTDIQRSFFRHITGRIIATIIDLQFSLGVYDTQCGAKIFRSTVIQNIIDKRFYTRWFFDVEILLRIRKTNSNYKAAEIPLSKWQNIPDSRLGILSIPSIVKDMLMLLNKY